MLLESGAELLCVEENVLSMTLDEMIRQKDVITDQIPQAYVVGVLMEWIRRQQGI